MMMPQPDFLKTDKVVPWSWGRGNDVWGMLQSAGSGDVERLQQLLEKDSELIRCQCNYRTPLHYAVRENQLDAAKWLLEQGADATHVSSQDWHDTPRQLATDRGYVEMSELLDEHLKSRYGICEEGEEVAQAIRIRDIQRAESLLNQHGPRIADERGNTPIHWAAMTRQMNFLRFLLRKGGDINAMRPDGAFPVDLTNGDYWYRGWRDSHPDALKNHWVMLGFMIAKGAEYDMTTACRVGDIEHINDMLELDPDAAKRVPAYCTWYSGYPLRTAVKAGYLAIVKRLLEAGADPNQLEHGLAPWGASLYEAVATKNRELVELLLAHGAFPNQEVESSESCMSLADDSTRQLLREHGAIWDFFGCCHHGHLEDLAIRFERNPQEANDAAAFAMVAQRGDRSMVELFLKYEPDLWERMPATVGKTDEIMSWMLDEGMNIQNTDWHGVHALHHCTDVTTAKTLLDRGAQINVIDGEHQSTPLGWAARRGDLEMARWLLDRGADVEAAGADWARPLRWAESRDHDSIVQLLTAGK